MRRSIKAAVLGALVAASASIAIAAQAPISTDGTDPARWDHKKDGLFIAPLNHWNIYESRTIRVGSVHVWNHAAEPFHLHPYHSVLVIDIPFGAPPGSGMDRDINLKPAPSAFHDSVASPIVNIQPPQAMHSISNTGPVDGHLVRVEFKTAAHPTKVERLWGEGPMPVSSDGSDPKTWLLREAAWNAAPKTNKIIWRDDNVRVLSVTLAPGEEEPFHIDPYPSVMIVDEAAAHTVRRKGQSDMVVPASGPRVYLAPPQASHAMKNTDRKPFHMIRIEFLKGFPKPPAAQAAGEAARPAS